jgi:hypothetical protein
MCQHETNCEHCEEGVSIGLRTVAALHRTSAESNNYNVKKGSDALTFSGLER